MKTRRIIYKHDDPDYYDICFLWYIDLDNIGMCRVEVYGKEDNPAHFHIVGEYEDFDCAVEICNAKYHQHTIDKLTDIQSKQLNEWLKEIRNPKNDNKTTRWQDAMSCWRFCNDDDDTYTKIQPRYDLINYSDKEKL